MTVHKGADGTRRRVGRIMLDLGPLRTSAAFRLLFAARTVSMLTYGIMSVALGWQVYALTGSSFQVGLVGFCLAASMMGGLVIGGDLADRFDRRMLMLWSRITYPAASVLLLLNAASPQPRLWLVYASVILGGLGTGVGAPAMMAATAAVLERTQLAAAGALTAIAVQAGALIGPSIAAALIGGPGLGACYAIVAAGGLATVIVVAFLPPLPPAAGAGGGVVETVLAGWRFVRDSSLIRGLLLIDLAAALFATPFALFPQFGTQVLGGDAATVGLLYTAPAAGAFVAALTSGWLGHAARPGLVLITAVVAWGLAIAAAGLSGVLVVTLLLLAIAGFCDTTSEVLRVALLQAGTPAGLQGRVSSLWMMQAIVAPAAGGLQIGATAHATSPAAALVIGGVLSVLAAGLIATSIPALRAAQVRQDEGARAFSV